MVKDKVTTNTGIAVSFERSSVCELKIVTVRTVGSQVTVTIRENITKDGMNIIPTVFLNAMLESSGRRVIEVTKENGNEC
jgi:hypothetical protein